MFFWQQSQGSLFFSDRRILAFTSLTYSACPLPASSFFPLYPAPLLIPWYRHCLWRTGNETLFFPSICHSHPFIAQKPWFPAMAVSHSPNELILREGRIPSYLCRERPSLLSDTLPLSLSLSLISPSLASPASSVHITVAKIRQEVRDLLSSHYRWGDEKDEVTVKWSLIVMVRDVPAPLFQYYEGVCVCAIWSQMTTVPASRRPENNTLSLCSTSSTLCFCQPESEPGKFSVG